MSFRSRVTLVIIWFALIFAAAGAWSYAQTTLPPQAPRAQPAAPGQAQTIISGADLGFRIDRMDGQTPVGAFVIRKDGQWVEVKEGINVRRVASR